MANSSNFLSKLIRHALYSNGIYLNLQPIVQPQDVVSISHYVTTCSVVGQMEGKN